MDEVKRVQAFDINGTEIKHNDLVKIVVKPEVNHSWLRVGNTLKVSYWEDRTLGNSEYICVFLKSKGEGKMCGMGVQDKRLEVVSG